MAPKRSKGEDDADAGYRPGQSLRQKKFPNRRKSVRQSLPAAQTPRSRDQPTLKRLWSLGRAKSDPIDVVDDIEDENDDEVDVPKPKRKKRKTASPGGKRRNVSDSQNTMTQMGYVTSFDKIMDEDENDAQPMTPRNIFPSTIPSSNTPMSALQFSTQPTQSRRSPSRSPLKTRSANVPESPIRTTPSPIKETPVKIEQPFSPWAIRRTPLFRLPEKPIRPPPLQHRTTIPDSDDMPVHDTQPQTSPRVQGIRPLKRIPSIVQDSQMGISGQEVTELTETQYIHAGQDGSQEEYQATLPYDYTQYDAVTSALERDAARCDQTQRLHFMRRTMRPDIVLDTQKNLTAIFPSNAAETLTGNAEFVALNGQVAEQGHVNDCSSAKSESLPGSPAKEQRSHHRTRFHNVDIVDLTADSFEALHPTTSGSPSPKHNSGRQMPIQQTLALPSSPPLLPDEGTQFADAVEYLPLNDTRPTAHKQDSAGSNKTRSSSSQPLPQPGDLLDANIQLPPSQVSTIGNTTQRTQQRTQNGRTQPTQRTQIKHDPDAPYFSTPRSHRYGARDVDLDEDDDEELDMDETVLSTQHLHTSNIEHVDLSDDFAAAAAEQDEEFIDIDYQDDTVIPPSSPFPIAPGHTRSEYQKGPDDDDDDDGEVLSSSLPACIPAPPFTPSPEGMRERERGEGSERAGPVTHAPHAAGVEMTDKGSAPTRPESRLPRPPREMDDWKGRIQKPVFASSSSSGMEERRCGRVMVIAIPDSDSRGDDDEERDDDQRHVRNGYGDADEGFSEHAKTTYDEKALEKESQMQMQMQMQSRHETGHENEKEEEEEDKNMTHDEQSNNQSQQDQDQDSWHFRPAREIVSDTQFSFPFLLPRPPSSLS